MKLSNFNEIAQTVLRDLTFQQCEVKNLENDMPKIPEESRVECFTILMRQKIVQKFKRNQEHCKTKITKRKYPARCVRIPKNPFNHSLSTVDEN